MFQVWNFEGHCVEFSKERVTWAQARKLCQTLHGDLVVIQDDKKQKFIYGTFAAEKLDPLDWPEKKTCGVCMVLFRIQYYVINP